MKAKRDVFVGPTHLEFTLVAKSQRTNPLFRGEASDHKTDVEGQTGWESVWRAGRGEQPGPNEDEALPRT